MSATDCPCWLDGPQPANPPTGGCWPGLNTHLSSGARSLIPQRLYWPRACDQGRMTRDCCHGDDERERPGGDKRQWAQVNVICEPFEPAIEQQGAYGPGDHICPEYGFTELPEQHAEYVRTPRPHRFTNADFTGSAFRRCRRQAN